MQKLGTADTSPRRRTATLMLDWAVALAVLLAGFQFGTAYLKSIRNPDGRSAIGAPVGLLGRAVMIASGRGDFCPAPSASSQLEEFLQFRIDRFDPATLPEKIDVGGSSVEAYHILLNRVVAAVWRMRGISWTALEPFMALLLGLTALSAYALFRLAMNRTLSLIGTALFVTCPPLLLQLPQLRDFSKAPFILAGMALLGWMLKQKTPSRRLPILAVLLGVLAGVGSGFRQDPMVLVPGALLAILFLVPKTAFRRRRDRLLCAAAVAVFFVLVARPMLSRMESASDPYHPLAQGFSVWHLDRCGLTASSVEPLAHYGDNFICTTAYSHARRATGDRLHHFAFDSPEVLRFTRDWVMKTILHFPADTVARVYGTVLQTVGGADTIGSTFMAAPPSLKPYMEFHARFAWFFRVAGLFIAAAALLAATVRAPRTGLALLFMTLFFCGCASLDNEPRHVFHLVFLPFWMSLFVVQEAGRLLRARLRGIHPDLPFFGRALASAAAMVAVLAGGWAVAALWQNMAVAGLQRQYEHAAKTPITTRAESVEDYTLFHVSPEQTPECRVETAPDCDTRTTLWALHLKARGATRQVLVQYRSPNAYTDFTQLMRFAAPSSQDKEYWIYFPVYELVLLSTQSTFEGVALPEEEKEDFLGLYRVDDPQMTLLPCAVTPSSDRCRGLQYPCDPLLLFTPECYPVSLWISAQVAESLGRMNDAVTFSRAYNMLARTSGSRLYLAKLYERAGDMDRAAQTLEREVIVSAGEFAACQQLDKFLQEHLGEEQRWKTWEHMVKAPQAFGHAWFFYGKALAGTDPDSAAKAFRTARRLLPSDPNVPPALQQSLIAKGCRHEAEGDIPAAVDAYREAILANPANDEPCRRLAAAMPGGNPATAMILWDEVREADPTNAQVAVRCGAAHADCHDLAGAREAFDAALHFGGEDEKICNMAGDAYVSLSAWSDAVAAYERALALNPGFDRQKLLAAAAFRSVQEGDTTGVIEAYKEAILANPANGEPCWQLRGTLSKESPAAARRLWEELRRAVPENAYVAVLCGAARAESLDIAGTREALSAALSLGGKDWSICDTAGDAYARIGAWSEAVTACEMALALNPGLDRQKLLIATAFRSEQEGDTANAIEALKKAVLANPANGEPCWRLSDILPGESRASARKLWDALKQEAPGNAFVAVLCGAARAADGDSAGACEALAAALRFGAGDWNICDTAGDAYASIGAWSDAVAAYERASALNPGLRHQRLLIATGCRDEQEGDIPGAIDAYVKAILANPSNGEPYWRLDTAFPKTSPDAVAALWGGIWEKVPENAAIDALYGESLAAANSSGPVRSMLEAALRLGGNDCNVLARAGNAYSSLADWKSAVHCYERALALNPGMESLYPRLEKARNSLAVGVPAPVRPS